MKIEIKSKRNFPTRNARPLSTLIMLNKIAWKFSRGKITRETKQTCRMHNFNKIRFCYIIEELAVSFKPWKKNYCKRARREIYATNKIASRGKFRRISLSRVSTIGSEATYPRFFSSQDAWIDNHHPRLCARRWIPGGGRWWGRDCVTVCAACVAKRIIRR